MTWKLLAAGVVAAAATSLAPGIATAQSATLRGTVAEAGSLQPVAYATVMVEGTDRSTLSNQTGQFTLTGLTAGSLLLRVTALGYEATSQTVTVAAGSPARLTVMLASRPLQVERLVVTANKTALSSSEVTAFTSVVGGEDIEAKGDVELVDALENTTGLMHTAQAGSFESIELRGMPRGGNEFETTLLLIDGVPQTDSRNSARVINLPIDNAHAVEIVHGPNSALYGRTAIGGAINIITAQPTAEPRATADLQFGEFGHRKAALSASGPVDDWAGYYVSWSTTGNDGFYSGDPAYDVDETSVFAKLTFTPDPKGQAMLSINSVVSDNSLPTSVPVIDGSLLPRLRPAFDLFSNLNLPTANFHQEELRVTSTYDRQLGDAFSFRNTFGYRDIQYKFEESGDIIGAPFELPFDRLTMYPFSLQTDEEVYYEELHFEYQPTDGPLDHRVLVGGSYERTTGFRSGDLIYTDPGTFGVPLNFLNPVYPSRTDWEYFPFGGDDYGLDSWGAFLQYQITPVQRLTLTAAGRYDRMRIENTETFQAGNPSIDETFEAFSPKFSALVRVLRGREVGGPLGAVDVNLYATYSEAFKPPRTPSGLNPSGVDPLDPEDISNTEFGAKTIFADGRASLDATYFHMKRDGIVVSTRQGPFFVPSNAGVQDFDGLEFALAVQPVPQFEVNVNAAFYGNRFGDFVIEDPAGDTDLTGNRLPLVPDLVFNWGITVRPNPGLTLALGLKHVGDRYLDQLNTYLLDGYALVDASMSWSPAALRMLRLTVSGHNLVGKEYLQNGDTSLAESV
ncbi:MAG: TonB-dependent receptor, partial [Gemmatimonadota bacterium]|nr:TonB-dependent receptor [Gemmatimonadota bacterium]